MRKRFAKFGRHFSVQAAGKRAGAAARLASRLGGLALVLAALPGCQNITSAMPVSQVRVINASPDVPGLDIYQAAAGQSVLGQGGSALAYNLGFGTVTSYVSVAPGHSTIAAVSAGSKQQVTAARGSFAASGQYTVLIGNIAGELTETVLTDQSLPAPAGQISVRVLDQATRFASAVDVYLIPSGPTPANVSAVMTNAVFGTNSGYINLPAGTYTLAVLPAGTAPGAATVPIYTGAKVTYAAGAARTLILLDPPTSEGPGFQVITAEDYD
jgi:hypothetical protein